MSKPIRLILLEDNPADVEMALRQLKKHGFAYDFLRVETEADFSQAIDQFAPDVILADYTLPHYDGISAMKLAQKKCPDVPFIFVSGTLGEESAIEAWKSGATDYVLKQRLARLGPAVQRALQEAQEREQRRKAEEELRCSHEQLRAVAARLQQTNQQLQNEIKERQATQAELRHARNRLQALSRKLLKVQEEERRHLACELHDGIGQALTALKINVQSMQRFPDPGLAEKRLQDAVEILDQILEQVRGLSLSLRPPLLEELGLVSALRNYLEQQGQRSGLTIEFNFSGAIPRLDPAVETACFRVAQEALTNVVRHAKATHVVLSLTEEKNFLILSVRDNGIGCELKLALQQSERGGNLGWVGMQERAALVGGKIEFRSAPNQGTEICATFPFSGHATEICI